MAQHGKQRGVDSRIGIVVIGRDEGARLARSLSSVLGLGVPVVYVDSASSDGSAALARSLGADVVELAAAMRLTAARGRNAGRARLRELAPQAEFVQFVDGDCELCTGWLEHAVCELDAHPDLAAIAGRLREKDPDASPYARLCDQEWNAPTGDVAESGGIACLRGAAFDQVGGFAAELAAGEEPELCARLRAAGHRIARVAQPMAVHDSGAPDFRSWWRRAVRSGEASAEAVARRGARAAGADARRLASAAVWGLLGPACACALALLVAYLGQSRFAWVPLLAALVAYVALFLRIARHRRDSGDAPAHARLYARHALLAKPAACIGALRYLRRGFERRAAATALAVLSGRFPLRSETFVYREVRALRARGRRVVTFSLREGAEQTPAGAGDLLAGHQVLYGAQLSRTLGTALFESARHPLRAAATLALALRDACFPGEPMRAIARARLLPQALAGIALARHLRRAGVAHLHCHFAHAPTSVGMYAARQAQLPFSFTGHANDVFVQRALLRRKLARASFVACITDWHAEFYRAIEPACAQRLHVVRCGVDLDEWRPQPAAVRARPTFEVLTVCRLVENKGVDLLLDGLARLAAREARPWRLSVAGDGPERARLESRAAELGIASNVRWLGAVENAGVRELMGSADVFALGCRVDSQGDRDGLPVVLMEAMACGLPVVCGELPALHELIEDGRSGIFFDPSRLDQLAASLERLRTDAAFGERLRSAGRQRVEREFSLRTNVSRLEAWVWSRAQPDLDSLG